MKKGYQISNGKIALLDESDFFVINPEAAAQAESICIVETRNAPEIPTFAYFLIKKEVCELKDEELDVINQAIIDQFPSFKSILDHFKNAKSNPFNKKASDWASLQEPGYFDLAAFDEYWLDSKSES